MSTPKQKKTLAGNLEAEQFLPGGTGAESAGEQQPAISPHTKLPVEHPESQAVEHIHYEMQQSLASQSTPAEAEAEFQRLVSDEPQ